MNARFQAGRGVRAIETRHVPQDSRVAGLRAFDAGTLIAFAGTGRVACGCRTRSD